MFKGMVFAGLLAISGVAQGADKPIYAPPPAWVKPAAAPPLPAKPDDAPVRLLLSDQQIAFEKGRRTIYSDVALLIQTPQGLAAGNLSFPWDPDSDELTIHKVAIRRDDKVIDVLAGGQTFTVMRRETNLESAMLDGVLTANMQPEGLQVGDVLQIAVSITSSDPVMKGHVEAIAGGWDAGPIGRARLRMQWPASMPLRLRQAGAMPAAKPVVAKGMKSLEIVLDDVQPQPGPTGAPLRYHLGRRIEASDFASWSELAALIEPLYRQAAQLPGDGALVDEVAKIAAASSDQKARAEAALTLVQNRIRYVALSMGSGGLVPADVATTWSRRYGDCKAKTAMLLAILARLGVAAEAVAVHTQMGDGLDERLPMMGAFDHVIVRATIDGRTYWLDGTRQGDTSLDRLTVPAFGWGLPLVPAGAALVRMEPAPLDKPVHDVSIHMDARAGLRVPAPTRIEAVFRGDMAIMVNNGVSGLTGDARDRALRNYWKREHDFIEPGAVGAVFDPATGELRLTLDGKAKMDWSSGWYETDGTSVGYRADFSREPGPDRDAPFSVAHPHYVRTQQTILLPRGFPDQKSTNDGMIDRTVAGVEYRRKWSLVDGVFSVEKTERSVVSEFPAKDAAAAQAALREMAKQTLHIKRPESYRENDAEIAALQAETPTTASAFIDRGNMLMDRGRFVEAERDLDRAIALEPESARALADRGIARAWQDKVAQATGDFDAALKLDPSNAVVYRGRGLIAQNKGDHRAAIDALTTSLQFDQRNNWALTRRAASHRALGDDAAALADASTALARDPRSIELLGMRANLYRRLGELDKMLADAAAMATLNPDLAYAHVLSGKLYASEGRHDEARKAFDRALAIEPEAWVYMNRAQSRPRVDRAGRLADLDAALKLDPKMVDALVMRARLQADAGDTRDAVATLDRAIALKPEDIGAFVQRGIVRSKLGDISGSERDFAAARAIARDPSDFNTLCWAKATAGVALESALADCERALAGAASAASFLDSKAFVLLRLGRTDEAIALYDAALKAAPTLAASLYGRAVAWSRKGDAAKAAADLALALKQSPDVVERFTEYGVTIETR
ncbi:tetratricopeptide repeat protein [Sphingomonas sp.]|uniref:tetratricopeptide repeat protein n=1 Tax=Sphingomonas sp. TaxID=28214 RepID=UPI002DD650CD|nr:tetratricopeptide repeat protein [Sphingomonas sp.]